MSRTDDPLHCIICGNVMTAMPGRAQCPNCGYLEGGDDLFPPDAPAGRPVPEARPPARHCEDTLFPLGPGSPKPGRKTPPRPRPPLPPMGWLFHNN